MKLKYEYCQMPCGENCPDIYIAGDGDESTDLVEVAFVSDNIYTKADMSINSLRRLRSLITEVLVEHETEKTRCPACGYTLNDTICHGDHKLCREYPFFEWERPALPKSEAV